MAPLRRCLLGDKVGLGKTLQALMTILQLDNILSEIPKATRENDFDSDVAILIACPGPWVIEEALGQGSEASAPKFVRDHRLQSVEVYFEQRRLVSR